MSELRNFHVEEMGQKYDRIENSLWYLSELALRGATEIDNYLIERDNDFSHVQELAEILRKYELKNTDTFFTAPRFPYTSFWKVIKKDSNKEIRTLPELALEMKLLRSELETVPKNSERLKEIISFLCDCSQEFSNEWYHPCHYLLSAR
jgi:hypothetical protein